VSHTIKVCVNRQSLDYPTAQIKLFNHIHTVSDYHN